MPLRSHNLQQIPESTALEKSISSFGFYVYGHLQGRHLDLLNFCSQLFQCSMAIDAVGDVVPEAVSHHPLSVRLPDAVALAEAAEGMPAGVGRSLW